MSLWSYLSDIPQISNISVSSALPMTPTRFYGESRFVDGEDLKVVAIDRDDVYVLIDDGGEENLLFRLRARSVVERILEGITG